MESGEQFRESIHLFARQMPALEQRQRIASRRQAPHHDAVFGHFIRAGRCHQLLVDRPDHESVRGIGQDRGEAQVDVGGETTIQGDFALAIGVALRACGERQKGQVDRLAHLVDPVSREEEMRDVGLTRLDRRERRRIADSALAVGLRPRQRLDQFRKT